MPKTGRPRKHVGKPQAVYIYDKDLMAWLRERSHQTRQPISDIVTGAVSLFRATVVSLKAEGK